MQPSEFNETGNSYNGKEAIPEIEFDQTANLTAEAGHDRLVAGAGADADADAEPIPELEFDQTVGW